MSGVRAFYQDLLQTPAFLSRYPYYAAILARVTPVADPMVNTLALSLGGAGKVYLHVNVEYFQGHPQHLFGLLLHEVHHLVLGHLSDAKFRGCAAPRLMELALEMSANENIEEPLPDGCIGWRLFQRYGIRAGQSTMERYRLLCQAPALPQPGGATVDDHRPWQGEPPPGATEAARRLVAAAIEQVDAQEDIPPGSRPPRLRLWGQDPGRLLELLSGTLRPPETYLDWRRALPVFASRTRAPRHSFRRPSPRFPERIGEVPGRSYVPSRAVGERPLLLAALDTSLSMSGDELAEVARHLRLLQPLARLVIAECDTQVQRIYPFAGALDEVHGRGGTDLRPVFAPEILAQVRPDGVVYFTDGQGPWPPAAPALPVLWVLTRPVEFTCPFGARAELQRPAAGSAVQPRRGRRAAVTSVNTEAESE